MVKRAINLVTKEFSGLHEAAFLLGLFALFSQILGLIRDRMLAHNFGAGSELDLYYAAFRIPDLIFVAISSCIAVNVLIPFLAEKETQGQSHVQNFTGSLFTVFGGGLLLVSALTYIFLPHLSHYLVPGFTLNELSTYINLTRMLLLSPILLGISTLFESIVQLRHRFFSYAIAPLTYNIGIILGIVFLVPRLGVYGLVLGVLLGAILHMCTKIPALLLLKTFPRPTLNINWSEIKEVIQVSLPRSGTFILYQLAILSLTMIATHVAVGSVAIFQFSMNLYNIPLMIIGSSYAVAAFPTLSRLIAKGEHAEYLTQMINATRHIIFWAMPATVLFIVLRAQIVRIILGTGLFDWTATRLTAALLALFMISLIAHALILLFARSYYAKGDTYTPLRYSLIGNVSIIVMAFLFLSLFEYFPLLRSFFEILLRVEDIPGTTILVLGLAYTIGLLLNVACYWFQFGREHPEFRPKLRNTVLQTSAAAILGGYISYHTLGILSSNVYLPTDTFLGILGQGFFAGVTGILVWYYLLKLMHNKEQDEMLSALHRKLWIKVRPIAGGPDEV